ncbi:MAG TPA: 7-cyano-7-deazaguanine synthase, partial [Idiomarina baltica]|nr:7-cyano-7-deazaguanine synthase [Idiomarina baltica]
NRNMILLSLAIGYAVSEGASAVYYGAHSGDHAIYPDCRPEFVRQMNVVSQLANYEPVEVVAPYLDVDKNAIL